MDGFTADTIYGADPQAPPAIAGPGSVHAGAPAYAESLRGVRGMHPAYSPTPYVVGLAILLVLLLHPRAGFNAGAKVG